MTPQRLAHLVNNGRHRHGSQAELARFLGVEPITLRRWMSGERPVPRQVEIIMEIMRFFPEVTAEAVDKLIQARDEGSET